jgi:hypothetical protein
MRERVVVTCPPPEVTAPRPAPTRELTLDVRRPPAGQEA